MIPGGRDDRERKELRKAIDAAIGELPEVAALRADVAALQRDVAALKVEWAMMRATPLPDTPVDVPFTVRLHSIATRAVERFRGQVSNDVAKGH